MNTAAAAAVDDAHGVQHNKSFGFAFAAFTKEQIVPKGEHCQFGMKD